MPGRRQCRLSVRSYRSSVAGRVFSVRRGPRRTSANAGPYLSGRGSFQRALLWGCRWLYVRTLYSCNRSRGARCSRRRMRGSTMRPAVSSADWIRVGRSWLGLCSVATGIDYYPRAQGALRKCEDACRSSGKTYRSSGLPRRARHRRLRGHRRRAWRVCWSVPRGTWMHATQGIDAQGERGKWTGVEWRDV